MHKLPVDRDLLRTDLPPKATYRECGVGPVMYYYRDPRAKKGSRVPIGRLKQSRALAVRVLDDQLEMALAHRHLFGKSGRAHVHRVLHLAIILGLRGRYEQRVKREIAQRRKSD
jgi:hypothetical protein